LAGKGCRGRLYMLPVRRPAKHSIPPQRAHRFRVSPPHGFQCLGVDLLGEDPGDRIATGQWPSDHAGLLATLSVVPEPGTMLLLVISLAALTVVRRQGELPARVRSKLPRW